MDNSAHLIQFIGRQVRFDKTQYQGGKPYSTTLEGECIGVDPCPKGYRTQTDALIVRVGVHPSTVLHTVLLKDCKVQ